MSSYSSSKGGGCVVGNGGGSAEAVAASMAADADLFSELAGVIRWIIPKYNTKKGGNETKTKISINFTRKCTYIELIAKNRLYIKIWLLATEVNNRVDVPSFHLTLTRGMG